METEPDKRRLEELDARLNALKDTQTPKPEAEEHYSMAQKGWRMVTELVSGLLIGVGLGYGLDRYSIIRCSLDFRQILGKIVFLVRFPKNNRCFNVKVSSEWLRIRT